MSTGRFTLDVPAPFRLDLTVWALRRRPHNAIDLWDGRTWRRSLGTADGVVGLAVTQARTGTAPRLEVALEGPEAASRPAAVAEARRLVTHVLGLDVELGAFYALAEADGQLSTLARRFIGMRPPRLPSVFEAIVNAVACQQLSLDVGIHLLNRLVRHLGSAPTAADAPAAFPTAEQLAGADTEALRGLGFSRAKATTLVSLGRRITSGEVDLLSLEDLDDGSVRDLLVGLPGIGRWSAEYTLLRGLGRLRVLPGDDVGARNSLRRRFGLPAEAGYEAVTALSRRWWPYGGLVYLHLLLDRLAHEGCLEASPPKLERDRVPSSPTRRGRRAVT